MEGTRKRGRDRGKGKGEVERGGGARPFHLDFFLHNDIVRFFFPDKTWSGSAKHNGSGKNSHV